MEAEEYISEQKKLLRREMRAKAASFAEESCDSIVLSLPEWEEAGTILMYSAISGEISRHRLMDLALK